MISENDFGRDDVVVDAKVSKPAFVDDKELSTKIGPTDRQDTEDTSKTTVTTSPRQAFLHQNEVQASYKNEEGILTETSTDSQRTKADDAKSDDKRTSPSDRVLGDRKPDNEMKIKAYIDKEVTGEETAAVTKSSSITSKRSSKKSIKISESSSSAKKKKNGGVSIIYVKPADNKLSRSSCTVLVAGKSISSLSGGNGKSNEGPKTPEDAQPGSKSMKRKGSGTRGSSATAERDIHHLPVAPKVESEDEARSRENIQESQTTMRKLSAQALPTSSHRMLSGMISTCKLSHSASELERRVSETAGSNETSTETNKV